MPVEQEPSLGYWCALVGQQYIQALHKLLAGLDIDRWYFVLVRLVEADGPVSQQELADQLHLDKATMVRAIDHLSTKGYVARQACPNDRRKHHLMLLPKARNAVKEIRAAYTRLNNIAFEGTGPARRRLIIGQLKPMLERLQQADLGPAAAPTHPRK